MHAPHLADTRTTVREVLLAETSGEAGLLWERRAVRRMTVRGAKGLEAAVVLARAASPSGRRPTRHTDHGAARSVRSFALLGVPEA